MKIALLLRSLLCVALVSASLSTGGAYAASYPVKPVRMLVGAGTGGGVDVTARIIADKVGQSIGQRIVVENRPGAGGNIAAEMAAKAAPDGYTIFMGTIAPLAINPSLSANTTFDPARDFAPISRAADSTNVLVVHPNLPAKSVKEFIALAKARPGELMYGSPLVGSAGHLAGELLGSVAGIKMVHVAYGSGPKAMIDLLSGQIQLSFATALTSIGHIEAGKLRALAVTTLKRSPTLPNVPTMQEAGIAGFEVNNWYGLVAPARTTGDVIQILNRNVVAALNLPDVQDIMSKQGLTPAPSTPEEFGAYIRSEIAKWGRVVKTAGISAK